MENKNHVLRDLSNPGKLILSFGVWFDSKAVGDFRLGQERVIIGCSNFSQLSFERYLQSMWSAMLDVCVCVD